MKRSVPVLRACILILDFSHSPFMKKYLSVLLLGFTFSTYAQYYPLGLNSPALKWKQINTPKVQVIYPHESEGQAQRVANLIHFLYDSSFYPLGKKRQKVSIILQNQTTISNGFVTVGPFRSEFFTTSPQYNFGGSAEWIDLLAIHEYRHIEQFTNALSGITWLSSIVFGEYGWGFLAGLALPRWFFEGDAVFYETALTNAGRGRMPAFENEYRALLLSDRRYGYEKASATSYKHYVPNHYNLGYHLTTHMRQNYGNETWSRVLNDAVSYRRLIYPFGQSVKKHTGMYMPRFYKSAMNELDSIWREENKDVKTDVSVPLTELSKRTFTNYQTPFYIGSDRLIVEKSAFNEIPGYYLINENGKEKKITNPGIYLEGNAQLSGNDRFLVWAELAFDVRWGNKDYSVIMLYDHVLKTKKRLTEKSKYFSPTLSQNGNEIAAIHSPESQQIEIHILNAENGNVVQTIAMQSDQFNNVSFPHWINQNQLLVIVKKDGTNALAIVNRNDASINVISPFWTEQIGYPVYHGDWIFFTGIFGGMENIFAFSQETQSLFQVTQSAFGARQSTIHPDGHQMTYSAYTPDGYQLRSILLNQEEWEKVEILAYNYYVESILNQKNMLSEVPRDTFETKPFKYNSKLINIHSFSPWFLPPNGGVIWYADNLMSTLTASGYYTYNVNEETASIGGRFEYGAYFPSFFGAFDQTQRSRYVPIYREIENGNGENQAQAGILLQNWNESRATIGITLPFNITKGNFFSKFWLTNSYHQLWVNYENPLTGTDESFGAYDVAVDFFALRRMAVQHIQPRLGITYMMNYQRTIGTEVNKSNYLTMISRVFLPGIGKNHSLNFSQSFQSEPYLAQYKFRDNFFYARGYFASAHDRATKSSVNYAFPIMYPDLPLGPFLFIKRIKANLFYDFSQIFRDEFNVRDITPITAVTFSGRFLADQTVLRSVGAEITFDVRFMRSLELNTGFRYSYLLDAQTGISNRSQFDFLLISISL